MTKQQLQKKLANLETVNDQLFAEIMELDLLMKNVGFLGGIRGLKETAKELQCRKDELTGESF